MEFKKNPELAEKPNHLHYPICRGRLDAIKATSQDIMTYTMVTSVILALLSLVQAPIHVVGWIPLMYTDISESRMLGNSGAIIQALICIVPFVMGALGYGNRKFFHVILFFYYMLMFGFSIFIRLSAFDIISVFIGGIGLVKTYPILSAYPDFKQLRNTEGYPMFIETYQPQPYKTKYGQAAAARYDQLKKQQMQQNSPAQQNKPLPQQTQPFAGPERRKRAFDRFAERMAGTVDVDILGNSTAGEVPADKSSALNSMPGLSVSVSAPVAAPDRFCPPRNKDNCIKDSGIKLR